MNLLRKDHLPLLLLLVTVGVAVGLSPARATVFDSDDNVRISHLHTIDDDFFAWSNRIDVDGTIDGDAFLGGNEVVTTGEIIGSVNSFAFDYSNTGVIGRSLRLFAFKASVGGDIDRSLVGMVNTFDLEPDARIGRDLHMFAERATIDGHVRGNMEISGEIIMLSGRVDGDVKLKGKQITISAPATIAGNLTYRATESIEIDTLGGVVVLGDIAEEAISEDGEAEETDASDLTDITLTFSKFLAAFLFGIIILALFSRYARETYIQLKTRLGVAAVTGFLAVIVTFFCIIILATAGALFIVGRLAYAGDNIFLGTLILVASTLLIPITSFASISGGVLLYIGKIVVAMLVGCAIWQFFKKDCTPLSKLQLFVGLAVLTLIFEIPYLGFVLYVLASIVGAGGIILGVKNCHRAEPETATATATAGRSAESKPPDLPPPPRPPESGQSN